MSRLTDLLRQLRTADAQLAGDIEKEIAALMKRRSFGLVFERHQPEAVELPGQPVRRGSKVRVLPARGETTKGDPRLWRVESISSDEAGVRLGHLVEIGSDDPERSSSALVDLVVVAEFEDKIYPGLVETGRIERGGDKPFHTVINAENFHALEMLTYTHRGKIDAIYIDPPYNTGARDWKYNNDYVEGDDDYRHSKWLAFMERRLLVARELLNPDNSLLIVTIDEKEYLRLGMLLEQTFPEARMQMVSSVISQKGVHRDIGMNRVDEYLFYVFIGRASLNPLDPSFTGHERAAKKTQVWYPLLRTGSNSTPSHSPGCHFPVFVDKDNRIVGVGDPISPGTPVKASSPEGDVILPMKSDGSPGVWQLGKEAFEQTRSNGYVQVKRDKSGRPYLMYIRTGMIARIEAGIVQTDGRDELGAVKVRAFEGQQPQGARTQWNNLSHDATLYGSDLLRTVLPNRKFPYPKSLYAVEDALRWFIGNKPDATVVDFFSGSGTTAHAVMRLNHADVGRRQCISITNNEVGIEEQTKLRKQGLRPGDPDWERWGICDYITKPRIRAVITGHTPDGVPIKGEYKFTDEFPMADGFDENAAFFTLTYESPLSVRHNRAFERIAPMLWMRAGSTGRIIGDLGDRGWDVSEAYAVLEDIDNADSFFAAMRDAESVHTVFVITDDDAAFQMVCRELPSELDTVRLYESYLQNFEINQGSAV